MSDFGQALRWMDAGFKVRRAIWARNYPDRWIWIEGRPRGDRLRVSIGGEARYWHPSHSSILAGDWERV